MANYMKICPKCLYTTFPPPEDDPEMKFCKLCGTQLEETDIIVEKRFTHRNLSRISKIERKYENGSLFDQQAFTRMVDHCVAEYDKLHPNDFPPDPPVPTLTTCPVCQGKVSSAAPACPHCGQPMSDNKPSQSVEVEQETSGIKCPVCSCEYYDRISTLGRALSVSIWGLASGKIGKQYECRKCGHRW